MRTYKGDMEEEVTHEEQRFVLGLSASEGSLAHAGLRQMTAAAGKKWVITGLDLRVRRWKVVSLAAPSWFGLACCVAALRDCQGTGHCLERPILALVIRKLKWDHLWNKIQKSA